MVYSPRAPLPRPITRTARSGWAVLRPLFRNPKYLSGKYVAGILKLVALRRNHDWPAVRITAISPCIPERALRTLPEPVIRVGQCEPEGNRPDHPVQFRSHFGENPENSTVP